MLERVLIDLHSRHGFNTDHVRFYLNEPKRCLAPLPHKANHCQGRWLLKIQKLDKIGSAILINFIGRPKIEAPLAWDRTARIPF